MTLTPPRPRHRLHRLPLFALLVVSQFALNGTTHATDNELDWALRAAFAPKSIAGSNLFTPTCAIAGHRFGVCPVNVVTAGDDSHVLHGTLIHHRGSGRGSQSVAFRITKRKGTAPIHSAEYRVDKGNWSPLSAPLADALTSYRTGRGLTPEQQQEHRQRFDRVTTNALDDTWNRAAEFLIARIALGDGC